MAALTVRGVSEELASRLRSEAKVRGVSMNSLVLGLLETGVGLSPEPRVHTDLDALVGVWNAEQRSGFEAAVADLERIDPGMWA